MIRVDAALGPADIARLPGRDLSRSVCVVFDVLRATTSLITGLANGMRAAIPVCTIEEALAERAADPSVMLGGERHGDRIEGFDLGNSPLEYDSRVRDRVVVTTTTNGTVALRACAGAAQIHAAALINLSAAAEAVRRSGLAEVLLVCAGTFDEPALEDIYAAGRLIALLGETERTDAAVVCASVGVAYGADSRGALRLSKNGRALAAAGRGADLDWAAKMDLVGVVGRMEAARLVSG
jgi:2-phosphosulfolactate phosphatase